MAVENLDVYNEYLTKLEAASNVAILDFKDLLKALQNCHDFFASQGCRISDHGLVTFYGTSYTDSEIEMIFMPRSIFITCW